MSQGKKPHSFHYERDTPQFLSDSDHFSDADPDLDLDLDLEEGGASGGMRFGGRFWCLAASDSESDSEDDLTSTLNRYLFTKRTLNPVEGEKTKKKCQKRGRRERGRRDKTQSRKAEWLPPSPPRSPGPRGSRPVIDETRSSPGPDVSGELSAEIEPFHLPLTRKTGEKLKDSLITIRTN